MMRADPFNQFDGLGDGTVDVLGNGRVDKNYNLWDRNPYTVRAQDLAANTLSGLRGAAGPSYWDEEGIPCRPGPGSRPARWRWRPSERSPGGLSGALAPARAAGSGVQAGERGAGPRAPCAPATGARP